MVTLCFGNTGFLTAILAEGLLSPFLFLVYSVILCHNTPPQGKLTPWCRVTCIQVSPLLHSPNSCVTSCVGAGKLEVLREGRCKDYCIHLCTEVLTVPITTPELVHDLATPRCSFVNCSV